jgi:hypothetical protein
MMGPTPPPTHAPAHTSPIPQHTRAGRCLTARDAPGSDAAANTSCGGGTDAEGGRGRLSAPTVVRHRACRWGGRLESAASAACSHATVESALTAMV